MWVFKLAFLCECELKAEDGIETPKPKGIARYFIIFVAFIQSLVYIGYSNVPLLKVDGSGFGAGVCLCIWQDKHERKCHEGIFTVLLHLEGGRRELQAGCGSLTS